MRVWDQYLDWQVSQGDHQRTVVLFERCLIPCALYEQFWAKYARYLERAHKEGRDRVEDSGQLEDPGEGDINKARNAFQTGLATVDQLRESRCSWTLRGWRETLKDGTQVMRAEKISEEELRAEQEVRPAETDSGEVENMEEETAGEREESEEKTEDEGYEEDSATADDQKAEKEGEEEEEKEDGSGLVPGPGPCSSGTAGARGRAAQTCGAGGCLPATGHVWPTAARHCQLVVS